MVQGFYGVIVIATTVMLILIYKSLAKDDPREGTVKYMRTVNGFLMIDVGIKIVGTVTGVLFWPPLVSIGVLVAAVFIMVARKGFISKG